MAQKGEPGSVILIRLRDLPLTEACPWAAFRQVLNVPNPICMVALPAVNKFFVQHEFGLYSYSLDLVGRAAMGMTSPSNVEASKERIATEIQFFRAGRVGSRVVGQCRPAP